MPTASRFDRDCEMTTIASVSTPLTASRIRQERIAAPAASDRQNTTISAAKISCRVFARTSPAPSLPPLKLARNRLNSMTVGSPVTTARRIVVSGSTPAASIER